MYKRFKKLKLAIAVAMLAAISAGAQNPMLNALEIECADGENSYVKLSDELKISFDPEQNIIQFSETSQEPITIAFADVCQCRHVYHDFHQSGIYNSAVADVEVTFDGHLLKLNVSHAKLYSISGMCLGKYVSDREPITINLDDFDSNQVLILNYGENKSIKIRK